MALKRSRSECFLSTLCGLVLLSLWCEAAESCQPGAGWLLCVHMLLSLGSEAAESRQQTRLDGSRKKQSQRSQASKEAGWLSDDEDCF